MSDKSKIYDYIKRTINPYGKPFEGTAYELGLKIMDYIENMDDEKENGWIPCSERLPDIDKIVLVSQTYSWEHFEDGASVTIGRLHKREENTIPYWEFQYYRPDFKHGTIMDNGIICPGSEYVIAWTSLPELYEED